MSVFELTANSAAFSCCNTSTQGPTGSLARFWSYHVICNGNPANP